MQFCTRADNNNTYTIINIKFTNISSITVIVDISLLLVVVKYLI